MLVERPSTLGAYKRPSTYLPALSLLLRSGCPLFSPSMVKPFRRQETPPWPYVSDPRPCAKQPPPSTTQPPETVLLLFYPDNSVPPSHAHARFFHRIVIISLPAFFLAPRFFTRYPGILIAFEPHSAVDLRCNYYRVLFSYRGCRIATKYRFNSNDPGDKKTRNDARSFLN